MFELLNRIRNFDVRKLTPTQIIIGIAALIIGLWLVGQIIGILTSLVPIAILVVILYFGFRMLSNRSEAADEAVVVDQAETVQANVTEITDTETAPAQAEAEEADAEVSVRRLRVEPKINPKTGLPEADLSRLEELENETKRVTDDVMAQIEERRRRLMKGDDS